MSTTVTEPAEVSEAIIVDYWGSDETFRHMLPDDVQYFECKIMNEGERAKFQKMTNQSMTLNRDQTAQIKVDQASERHSLILTSVVGWKLYAKDQRTGEMAEAAFSKQLLEKWLEKAPPKIVDDLEFAIRKANPWMQADMSVAEIDKEIDRLQELRVQVKEREAGEAASATK